MQFDSITSIRQAGFEGFLTVAELQATKCVGIPKEKGVYALIRTSLQPPMFLPENPTLPRNGRSPTIETVLLETKWVQNPVVMYIGKAGTTLQKRLYAYMKHGQCKVKNHWGGRYIWQLADSGELLVCWKRTPQDNPTTIETLLIQEFKATYGKRPFANLRD